MLFTPTYVFYSSAYLTLQKRGQLVAVRSHHQIENTQQTATDEAVSPVKLVQIMLMGNLTQIVTKKRFHCCYFIQGTSEPY